MNIGERLRQLREARSFSQGEIEKRTALLRSYVSRVECPHTTPSIETLEKWAKALELDVYQLFFSGKGDPKAPSGHAGPALTRKTRQLLEHFEKANSRHQQLLLDMARYVAKRKQT